MEREAEGAAFAKACAYLNYHAAAKWAAYAAAVGVGLVYVALLAVLWLFTDLMVFRGRLPGYYGLTPPQQEIIRQRWGALSAEDRNRLAPDLKGAEWEQLNGAQHENAWHAFVRDILERRVSQEAADRVPRQWPAFTEAQVGILSLVVRDDAAGKFVTPFVAWLARWNHWMWESQPTGRWPFPPYLTGLFFIALVLGLLGALLSYANREAAARASIEAATRLRRAVYHHTFRLGTLAFRALGPSEAVTIFTRHIEAVHDALYTRLTTWTREPVRFALFLAFALVVQFWLALAFLLFAAIVWVVGGQATAYFRRQGRLATHQASERLTIMRESLMMMRLVKCYIMEQFNQARVERQLSRYAQVSLVRYRGEAISRPLLLFLGFLCALVLLFVAGVIVLYGQTAVPSVVVLATALVRCTGR